MTASEQKLIIHGLKGECKDLGVTDICVALARKDTKINELEIQVQEITRYAVEVLRISDRKHDAWDGLKQALSTTTNPDEWVRRDRLEVVAYADDYNNIEHTKKQWMIDEPNVTWSPLYRIKDE